MKYVGLAAVFALVFCTVAAYAGPLTGVPTIEFSGAAAEQTGAAPKDSGFAVGLGYSTFDFKLNVGGSKFSWKPTGPILSVDYFKAVGENGGSFVVGGWYADTKKDGVNGKFSTVHIAYNWDKNWGFELGQFMGDLEEIGKTSYHLTYKYTIPQEKPIVLQFGIGSVSKGKYSIPTDGFEIKTDYSVYGNATFAIKDAWTANVGLWYLKQKVNYDPTFGLSNDDLSLLQWSLGVGYNF